MSQTNQPSKPPINPKPKQKKAFKALIANDMSQKPRPMGEILREVGYTKASSEKPFQVIRSKGFQELLEKHGITEDYLTGKLKEGLEADITYNTDGDTRPDFVTRHKYLETGLRLKGVTSFHSQPAAPTAVYNTQINNTTIDPNSTEAKQIIDNTLDILMDQTRAS